MLVEVVVVVVWGGGSRGDGYIVVGGGVGCCGYDGRLVNVSLTVSISLPLATLQMGFTPDIYPNSCVLNATAYISGCDKVPDGWMTDINNLHNIQGITFSIERAGGGGG